MYFAYEADMNLQGPGSYLMNGIPRKWNLYPNFGQGEKEFTEVIK